LSSKAMQQAVREEDEVCERLNLLLDILVAHRELCERHEKGVAQDHNKALAKMLSLKKRQMQGVIRGTDVCMFLPYSLQTNEKVMYMDSPKTGHGPLKHWYPTSLCSVLILKTILWRGGNLASLRHSFHI